MAVHSSKHIQLPLRQPIPLHVSETLSLSQQQVQVKFDFHVLCASKVRVDVKVELSADNTLLAQRQRLKIAVSTIKPLYDEASGIQMLMHHTSGSQKILFPLSERRYAFSGPFCTLNELVCNRGRVEFSATLEPAPAEEAEEKNTAIQPYATSPAEWFPSEQAISIETAATWHESFKKYGLNMMKAGIIQRLRDRYAKEYHAYHQNVSGQHSMHGTDDQKQNDPQ